MSCLHPNLCVQYNKTLINKQGEPYKAVHMVKASEIQRYEDADNFENWPEDRKWYYDYDSKKNYKILRIIQTRCGKCDGCKWDDAKTNAIRCALETTSWKDNWFITRTYDEKNVPFSEDHIEECYRNKVTGELYEVQDPEAKTLWLPDSQTFNKDMREYWRSHYDHIDIRFYGCGEYGPITDRPHYHDIYWNLPIEEKDLKPLGKNRNGQMLWTHDKLREIWGKGHIAIGKVTYESCAYVAQYCTKKKGQHLYGEVKEEYYKRQGKIPEYVNMSRRPGIGKKYYEENFWDIYANDEIIIKTKKGVQTVTPSRYYDNLFDNDGYTEYLEEIKEARREAAKENMKCELSRTTLTEKEYLQQKERTLKDRTKILTRQGLDTPLK